MRNRQGTVPMKPNWNGQAPFLNSIDNRQTDIQGTVKQLLITLIGDNKNFPFKITAHHVEEALVRDEQMYLPLSSSSDLKRKKGSIYVLLDFENGLKIVALVNSRAHISAIGQNESERTKLQSPANIFEIDKPQNFRKQVANGHLEKPLAKTTFKFDIGHNVFSKHFVLLKNLTKPITGLLIIRHSSVVIDITHRPIHFSHIKMQVKSAASESSALPQAALTDNALRLPPLTTKTITAFVDDPPEW